jgi:UDP-GlcNAc:undecaprenyl-phosphate GlcNAc-1-phosphate transferase
VSESIWSAGIGFACTLLFLYLLRPIAVRLRLVDRPSERKSHEGEIPLVGGIAMFLGFAISVLTLPVGLTALRPFFAASLILVVVGVLDDLRELSSRARFAAQILAAAIMVWWGGVALFDLGHIGPGGTLFGLPGFEVVFSVFCAVGVINALNMVDGLDGLAGGVSLVPLLGLALVAHRGELAADRDVLLLLAVVCLAFLWVNVRLPWRRRALAFMGDAGSMFLGFAITWFVVKLSQGPERAMAPVTALWLLLVPLFDTVWLLFKRPLSGRLPTAAGREHLHHVLQMAGCSPVTTLCVICALSVAAAMFGFLAQSRGWSEQHQFAAFLGLFALYCAAMGTAWRRRPGNVA